MAYNSGRSFHTKNESTVLVDTQTSETGLLVSGRDLLIIDCGSRECKAGFASENHQRVSIPTIVDRPKEGTAVGSRSSKNTYVGVEAEENRFILNVNMPIERGIITNWEDMEVYFEYIFKECLQIDPTSYHILLTETLNNPSKNREKLVQLMLEKFHFQSCFLTPAPPLALYAYGFHTGVVLDSGEGQTHIVPVHEGLSISDSTRYIPLGGNDIDKMLDTILTQSGKSPEFFQLKTNKEVLRHIKEELCYVALNFQEEFSKTIPTKSYRLPDGNYLDLNKELFSCVETMFRPTMLNVKTGGIHENVYRAIQLSDMSIKHLLYDHIVLSGGNTLFPGFQDRLYKEMRLMSEPDVKMCIHAKPDRKNAVYFGACLLGSLAKFKSMMITCEEYLESGPSIVERKCF